MTKSLYFLGEHLDQINLSFRSIIKMLNAPTEQRHSKDTDEMRLDLGGAVAIKLA